MTLYINNFKFSIFFHVAYLLVLNCICGSEISLHKYCKTRIKTILYWHWQYSLFLLLLIKKLKGTKEEKYFYILSVILPTESYSLAVFQFHYLQKPYTQDIIFTICAPFYNISTHTENFVNTCFNKNYLAICRYCKRSRNV